MFLPSTQNFPLKIDRPACEDHIKTFLTCKNKYRFHVYNAFDQFGPYTKIKSGEAFQVKCSYCDGWRDLYELEIYGRQLFYTDKEAQEIKKFLFHEKDYPSHIARKLYKHYRKQLRPVLNQRAVARQRQSRTFWFRFKNAIRKLMK